jgi:hypothetical protein
MATYKDIQDYIKNKYCITVKTCWIAHVKEICNLNPKRAPNRIGSVRKHPCPPAIQKLIESAFSHFGMI